VQRVESFSLRLTDGTVAAFDDTSFSPFVLRPLSKMSPSMRSPGYDLTVKDDVKNA
jgi:hypothetical protein